jgi:glucose-1-phosphate thymidylyltransferase
MLAREYISGPLFIIFVDTIFDTDLKGLSDESGDGVIFVHPVDDPSRFGVVTTDSDGYIDRFVEKPRTPISNLALVGLYYIADGCRLVDAIDALIERNIQTKGEFYLADALQLMVEDGARLTTRPLSVWEDCGTRPALLRANRFLLDELSGPVEVSGIESVIVEPSSISPDAVIERSIVGPNVYVGPGCRISGSIVGPHVSLDADVKISSSILNNAIVERGADIQDSGLSASLIGVNSRVRDSLRQLNVGDHSEVDLSGTQADLSADDVRS